MGEQKSKFPSLGDVSSMAGKLFNDVKKSVCEIVSNYKTKQASGSKASTQKTDRHSKCTQ